MSEENVTGAEATPQTDTASESTEAKAEKKGWKKGLFFFLKLAFSVGMLWVIFRKVLKREGAEDLGEQGAGDGQATRQCLAPDLQRCHADIAGRQVRRNEQDEVQARKIRLIGDAEESSSLEFDPVGTVVEQ